MKFLHCVAGGGVVSLAYSQFIYTDPCNHPTPFPYYISNQPRPHSLNPSGGGVLCVYEIGGREDAWVRWGLGFTFRLYWAGSHTSVSFSSRTGISTGTSDRAGVGVLGA